MTKMRFNFKIESEANFLNDTLKNILEDNFD